MSCAFDPYGRPTDGRMAVLRVILSFTLILQSILFRDSNKSINVRSFENSSSNVTSLTEDNSFLFASKACLFFNESNSLDAFPARTRHGVPPSTYVFDAGSRAIDLSSVVNAC